MVPAARTVTRREWLVLGGLLGSAVAAPLLIGRFRPVGQVVEDSPVLHAAQAAAGPGAGNPRGSVHFIVFTDFNCPACRAAHADMMAAVVADGDTRLRFLDWPIFGADSRDAARVALAADAQGLYLPVHATLMRGGRADRAAAEAAVVAAGGDVDRLRATLTTQGSRIEGQLGRNAFHAFALGLGGTPGHLIGRVLLRGAASRRQFARSIARARRLA